MKKFFLIAAIVIIVIILIGVVYVYINKDKIINYAVDSAVTSMETKICSNLPASMSQDSVKALFDETLLKIKDGTIDKQKLQGIILSFRDASKDKHLDSLEVSKIIQEVKDLSKIEPQQ